VDAVGGWAVKLVLRYLSVRLFLLLMCVMLAIFSVHTYLDIKTTSDNLTDYVFSSAHRASDLIVRSTRYSMLLNRKEDVHQTINTLGSEPGFVGINIYNKTGEVIFSTDSLKVGEKVDLQAEACIICHASDSPLVSVPAQSRMRVYESAEQGHILGLINPIRNEPECFNASCHAHTPDQTVLGVLDVKMSLASVDERVASTRNEMIVSTLVMTLIIASISGLFIYRVVRKPIRALSEGMNGISFGNLDARIELNSKDEIGDLARAFNKMAADLKKARGELEDWAEHLEERIDEKTGELQQAQAQIIHMEKMASLGKLSASVAHEINNPLFGILTYAKLIGRELDSEYNNAEAKETIRKYIKIIQDESSRCGDIVKGLLEFARRTGGEFSNQHLHEIINKTLLLLSHHFEMQQINVNTDFRAEEDELVCDARQIQQAVIAPCINSVEAMPDGGTLTIETDGDESVISVKIIDTGIGIPEETRSKIFEPFYTTKEGEAGLGLGLAIVFGIVQRHDGEVRVESAAETGTIITLTLPREHVEKTEQRASL
jgi:two-component system NtrC family sensor kinase